MLLRGTEFTLPPPNHHPRTDVGIYPPIPSQATARRPSMTPERTQYNSAERDESHVFSIPLMCIGTTQGTMQKSHRNTSAAAARCTSAGYGHEAICRLLPAVLALLAPTLSATFPFHTFKG
ncbi:unnamed protein product [Scytosiphon promiscuus]